MLRWVSFSPSKTQLPSVLPLCFLHPMTGKMFPLSLLAVPLLPFCYLSVFVGVSLSDPPLLCRKACHSLIPSNTHARAHIRVSEKRERGKLQDCVYFCRIIEIRLDANGRSCPPKCLNISHTHTYTQRHANLHVNSSKRHLVARRLVYPSVYVCWGVYRQR